MPMGKDWIQMYKGESLTFNVSGPIPRWELVKMFFSRNYKGVVYVEKRFDIEDIFLADGGRPAVRIRHNEGPPSLTLGEDV